MGLSPVVEFAVIRDARRRQRRRRLAIAIAALAAGLGAYVAVRTATEGSGSPPAAASQNGQYLTPAAVFSQQPSMGVACGVPNWVACDRVALEVGLARPAVVSATFAGHRLRLVDPHWSYVARATLQPGSSLQPLYVYAGFVQAAGLMNRLAVQPRADGSWFGQHAPSPLVRFRVAYASGQVVSTQQRVQLRPGWG